MDITVEIDGETVTFTEAETIEHMQAHGFKLANMGGNCEAWRRDISGGRHILITCGEDGQDVWGDWCADEWLVCLYSDEHPEESEGQDNGPMVLSEALETADVWAAKR